MNYLDEIIGQINRLPAVNDNERLQNMEKDIATLKAGLSALVGKLAEIKEPETAPLDISG